MGVFIYMDVSKTITDEEWMPFYEEASLMAKSFGLYDVREREFYGKKMCCAVPVEEYEKRGCTVWCAVGDLVSMKNAEPFYMPKDFRKWADATGEEELVDALLSVTSTSPYAEIEDYGDWNRNLQGLWFNKTQGEHYHMYLLAIACVAAEYFGNRVHVYGDITKGQCRAAAKLAGKCLGREISLPDTCDADRLCRRIEKLPLPEEDKVKMFFRTYLGDFRTTECRDILKRYFPEGIQYYWENTFKDIKSFNHGLKEKIHRFLSMGFGLEELCKYIYWHREAPEDIAEQFIRFILETELHIEDKDCKDCLVTNSEEEAPYSIYTQMAQCFFMGARNWRIAQYEPLSEIERILQYYYGQICDVKSVIKDAVNRGTTETPADRMNQFMDEQKNEIMKLEETYEIWWVEELPYYKQGDSIEPKVKEKLNDFYQRYEELHRTEETYAMLKEKSAEEKGRFLIAQNRNLLLTEEEWKRIFSRIEEEETSFARYYPMVRINISNTERESLVRGLALNDALWEYCENLRVK